MAKRLPDINRVLGVDLAWSEAKRPNESGVVALGLDGQVIDADWTRGVEETHKWITHHSTCDTLLMIDAPLVVTNDVGPRDCERQVGQRYGRWQVSANSTNEKSPRAAGKALLSRLESTGWTYDPGFDGPPQGGQVVSECYPYTTIVGAEELGYEVLRPTYKRKPKSMRIAEFRPIRAEACNGLIAQIASLVAADPPLDLSSHPTTALLLADRSPLADREYKHREDLIDAALSAWTGLLWLRHGLERCQVLGDREGNSPRSTIIAPARPQQRRP